MYLETFFKEEDIKEIYNKIIICSILKYEKMDEDTKKFFERRYKLALKQLNDRQISFSYLDKLSSEQVITNIENDLLASIQYYDMNIANNKSVINFLAKQIEKIILQFLSNKKTEIEKISAIFDFVTNYITYSEDYFNYCLEVPPINDQYFSYDLHFDFKNQIPVDSSLEGMLVIGQGLCNDISHLIKYLGKKENLNIETISCYYKEGLHTLNLFTDKHGNSYLIDATRKIRKDFSKEECFLVSSSKLNKDNNYEFFELDKLSKTKTYPIINTSVEEINNLITNINFIRPEVEDLNTKATFKL